MHVVTSMYLVSYVVFLHALNNFVSNVKLMIITQATKVVCYNIKHNGLILENRSKLNIKQILSIIILSLSTIVLNSRD